MAGYWKLLLVDDEPSILHLLEIGLQAPRSVVPPSAGGAETERYELRAVGSGQQALALARDWRPDLVLLDVLLPDLDGYEVCRRLRQLTTAPVILLSALRHERSHEDSLEAGADDFVAKPFGVAALGARVEAALRRSRWLPPGAPAAELSLDRGRLLIDLERRLVQRGGRVVPLSDTLFRLLAYLAANAGRSLTHREVLEQLWGPESADEGARLATQVGLLRRRLEVDPQRPRLVVDAGDAALRLDPGPAGD